MRFKTLLLVLLGLFFVLPGTAQEKKRLSHDDYAGWNNLSRPMISPSGDWAVYEVNPQDGDGRLVIRHLPSGREHVVPRAYRAAFSPGQGFLVFHIKPPQAVERQARVDKKRRDEMPVDSLGIFIFGTESLQKHPALQSFALPEDPSDWVAYVIDHARIEKPADTEEETVPEDRRREDEPKEEQEEKPGKVLVVANPLTGEFTEVKAISEFVLSPNGNLLAGLTQKENKDTLDLWEVIAVDIPSLEQRTIDSRHGEMKQLAVDREGGQLAWLSSSDTIDAKAFGLYLYEGRRDRLQEVVTGLTAGMPEGYTPSEHRRPSFSDDGRRLFFATAPAPRPEPEDTLLANEKYSLDIWHWEDPMLQPQQKVMASQLQRRSFQAVYHIRQGTMVQLADEEMHQLSLDDKNNSLVGLGQSTSPYMIERQWTGGNPRDLYLVDLNDGSRKLLVQKVQANAGLSPEGQYVTWYDTETTHWMAHSVEKGTTVNLTRDIPFPVYNEENDLPMFARPHGLAGWTPEDEFLLLYDRYDVWKVDPSGRQAPENLTLEFGREHQVRFRVQQLDDEDPAIKLDEPVYLSAFDEYSKRAGFFRLHGGRLSELVMAGASFSDLQKARDADRFLWRRGTFNIYPDLWTSTSDFSSGEKLSDVNPQQADYYWGSVELVEWHDFDNQPLQGLMYFPEDLDENKKYPVLIYFYERSSHSLYQHFIPSPSRSTINRSYCTSNGYIVFVPDITYKEGFPGESAYNAIVSGAHAMADRYPVVDRDRMGLQGQSWGGYQIAYLVTRTNMFRAAMAGAPVSNMVSAYGGIRWQTGINRQFQYEQTQSRIGGTLWERPFRYIENSPVFFADKIETPLLMMHNDADGAVPWYQGIELFVAMRRLSKPVWMLVYNDEAHNLTRWPNRMDLSVRMYQFFDHFLKDGPAPVWLRDGLPYQDKGKTHGYELTE